MTKKEILDLLGQRNELELLNAWNEYQYAIDGYDEIINNDDYGYDKLFNSIDEALRACCCGDYRYTDKYIRLNVYGNLESFNYVEACESPYNADELADWLFENQERIQELF